ncbi:MAG: TraR/DksA C4-type zinc finger protein [Anaerolineae bacterium]|jgi:RNA polymerase-binding transcription factor DksA|nr:TraR/DksA C4-type zinc finger protein [Anaerolineae bacterium]
MPLTYAELQQLLVKQESELQSQLESIQSEVREDGVGYSNHIADAASEVFEQARNVSLLQQLRRSHEDVLHAMGKFDDATYGICESCGALIDIPRLEALPSARYCVTCQTRLEGKR